jgi:iron complex transport system ATP-binding protein
MNELSTNQLSLSYGDQFIIEELNLHIPKGKITILVGSNGCGKSTLLKSLCRLLRPCEGTVVLDGQDIFKMSTKAVARKLAVLPQGPTAPEGLTVSQLVRQGRYPHQNFMGQWTRQDEEMVKKAMADTNVADIADRTVDSLSGGQRQRAWIAMTLAQGTEYLLLDEPTTYLDLAHQIEVLDLLFELNAREGRTIVMVLHDLNLSCRYGHHMVALSNRRVYAEGVPEEVMTAETVREVFHLECVISTDPIFGTPLLIPHGRGRSMKSNQVDRHSTLIYNDLIMQ